MIVFDGMKLILLAIYVLIILVIGIAAVIDSIASAAKKRQQKRIDNAFKEEGE